MKTVIVIILCIIVFEDLDFIHLLGVDPCPPRPPPRLIYIYIYIYIYEAGSLWCPRFWHILCWKRYSHLHESTCFENTGALMQARTPFRNMTWLLIVKLVLSCRREHHTHVWCHMQCSKGCSRLHESMCFSKYVSPCMREHSFQYWSSLWVANYVCVLI